MPKYGPIITHIAWQWHLDLEKAVAEGRMKKVPSDFTISGWSYMPIDKAKEDERDEIVG